MAALTRKDIPNVITVGRIGLVLPVVWSMLEQRFGTALGLFVIAGVSDGLDGFLAKRFNWSSRLGAILDPIADKLLLVCSYASLGWLGTLPLWLVIVVLGRDLVILTGAVAYHLMFGPYEMQPSWMSKVNTFLQILLVILVTADLALGGVAEGVIRALVFTVLATSVWSGVDYVWTWSVRARGRR